MARLVSRTGVVINVSDEKAERLGSAYAPVEDAPQDQEAPAKKTAARKASK